MIRCLQIQILRRGNLQGRIVGIFSRRVQNLGISHFWSVGLTSQSLLLKDEFPWGAEADGFRLKTLFHGKTKKS